jgi:hypothetical protein
MKKFWFTTSLFVVLVCAPSFADVSAEIKAVNMKLNTDISQLALRYKKLIGATTDKWLESNDAKARLACKGEPFGSQKCNQSLTTWVLTLTKRVEMLEKAPRPLLRQDAKQDMGKHEPEVQFLKPPPPPR